MQFQLLPRSTGSENTKKEPIGPHLGLIGLGLGPWGVQYKAWWGTPEWSLLGPF